MSKFTAIGCHIYAGGFTVGISEHFDVLGHLEDGNFGVATAQQNFPHLEFELRREAWEPAAEEWLEGGRLDLLYSNPPCAAWSKAGTFAWKGRSAYKEAQHHTCHTERVVDLALRLRPTLFVWESVPPAWEHGHEFVRGVARQFIDVGYSVTLLFTDAVLHGVPQRRPRFHLIAHRYHLTERLLEHNYKEPLCLLDFLKKAKTSPKTLKEPPAGHVELLTEMQRRGLYGSLRTVADQLAGHEYAWRTTSTGRDYRVGRPSFLSQRLHPDGHASAFTGDAKKYHPTEPRFLAVEEQAALGGWPRGFKFTGSINNQYAEVAKAVQPATARYLGEMLRLTLEERRVIRKPYFALLDQRPLTKGKELVYELLSL